MLKPLAEDLRPQEINDFVGQTHLKERILTLYSTQRLPSLLLFGPPGCGKSSLALLLAKKHSRHILRLSAPEVGLQQLRKQLQGVEILILDELHRFSKTQQDFFLPILESGEITMIATTTENPSFSITKQLLSRLHVLRLKVLSTKSLKKLALRTCISKNLLPDSIINHEDNLLSPTLKQENFTLDTFSSNLENDTKKTTLSEQKILPSKEKKNTNQDQDNTFFLSPEQEELNTILDFLCTSAHGDARTLFNLLEYVLSLPLEQRTLSSVRASMPDILARHDKDGDSHYELASALIKSIRGSDPDAALYYLACLLEGGEDPRFITRRLIISASEDIGLADPNALPLAVSCQQAVEFIGMPEGFIPMSQIVTYLALAPKSNSTYNAYHMAAKEVKSNGIQPVPMHLRNASTKLQKEWGYGKGYKYPHNFPSAYIEQEYLPDTLHNTIFYQAKNQGDEARLIQNWKRTTRKK